VRLPVANGLLAPRSSVPLFNLPQRLSAADKFGKTVADVRGSEQSMLIGQQDSLARM
jgi:hypothetical protein